MLDNVDVIRIPVHSGAQWSAVSVVSNDAVWWNSVRTKIKEFKGLQENWDTYGSGPIQEEVFKVTQTLLTDLANLGLPEPQIFPVPGGGIQVELTDGGKELEIEMMPDGSIQYLMVYPNGFMYEDEIPSYNADSVFVLVAWLKRSER